MGASGARSSRRKWLLTGLAVVAVLALLLYGAASFFVYDQVGKAPQACWENDANNTPASFPIPAPFPQDHLAEYQMPAPQDVTFPSRDPQIPDAKLAGWWIPGADAQGPAVILVHGVQSCRRESSVLLAASMLHRAGFSVFLMDLRDHGDSEGDDMRFAAGSEGIGLFVADQIKDGTGLSKILVPGTIVWARLIASDDLTRFDPIDEVADYGGRHIAFVHGAQDKVLPASMANELHDAAAAADAVTPDAWIIPNAGHTRGIYHDPTGYEQRLVSFFTTALGAP